MSTEIKVLDKGFVRLVDHMGSDAAIVQMARVSYGAGTTAVSKDKGLIRYLIRNHHTSPLEGVTFKFHIKAPIFVFRQWHRHRTWSYNEYSGRYSVLSDECYVPEEKDVTKQNPNNKQGGTDNYVSFENLSDESVKDWTDLEFKDGVKDNWKWAPIFEETQNVVREQYNAFIKTEMRRELARINLPLAQYSEMYAVVDLHNLFHFLRLRLDSHAQYEIRVYAQAMYECIKDVVPISCEAFDEYILNSTNIHKKEQEVIKDVIETISNSTPTKNGKYDKGDGNWNIKKLLDEKVTNKFENKRERKEAYTKILKFFE